MVTSLAPDVSSLIFALLPWLSVPQGPGVHEPVPPTPAPSDPGFTWSSKTASIAEFLSLGTPSPTFGTFVRESVNIPRGTFSFVNRNFSIYGFDLGKNFIVIPDDGYMLVDPRKAHILYFMEDTDDILFTLHLPGPATVIMPPPDGKKGTDAYWHSDQSLALVVDFPLVQYSEDY